MNKTDLKLFLFWYNTKDKSILSFNKAWKEYSKYIKELNNKIGN